MQSSERGLYPARRRAVRFPRNRIARECAPSHMLAILQWIGAAPLPTRDVRGPSHPLMYCSEYGRFAPASSSRT
jgi:hypothetical protein